MAKGRQLKRRIRSIKNTRKITRTMELVATSTERPIDPRLYLAVQGNPQIAWDMLREGAILLSEPLAAKFDEILGKVRTEIERFAREGASRGD